MIAGHTYPFRHGPLVDALDCWRDLGVRRVEVWLGHLGGRPERAAAELARRGLDAVAVGAGGFYSDDPEEPRAAFRAARILGAPLVVACVGPGVLPTVLRVLPPGLTLCLENHWDQPLARPRAVRDALRRGSGLAACLDTGHALAAGADPVGFARALGPALRHVHLKDARRRTPLEGLAGVRLRRRLLRRPAPVWPGRGDLDAERFLRTLGSLGFRGSVALEYEGDEPARALAELVARVSASAGGAG